MSGKCGLNKINEKYQVDSTPFLILKIRDGTSLKKFKPYKTIVPVLCSLLLTLHPLSNCTNNRFVVLILLPFHPTNLFQQFSLLKSSRNFPQPENSGCKLDAKRKSFENQIFL